MVAIEAVKWEILFQLVSSCLVVFGATSKQTKKKETNKNNLFDFPIVA